MPNIFTLPKFVQHFAGKYITRSGGDLTPDDIAVRMALSLDIHNSPQKIRELAATLVPLVCLEHQPNMKRLSREPDDAKVIDATLKIINRVCDLMGIYPGEEFLLNHQIPAKPEPILEEEEVFRVLQEIANELSDPTAIAREIRELIKQLPPQWHGQMFLIAGAKNPRAVIQAAVRQFKAGQ